MAKEPKDRDDAAHSKPPAGQADAARKPDATHANRQGPNFLDDESFLLDVGDEAPRAQGAAEQESPEEWILVDDDAVGAPTDGLGGGSRPGGSPVPRDVENDEEAARLLAEMQAIASELSPSKAFEQESAARRAHDGAPSDAESEVAAAAPAGDVPAEPVAPSGATTSFGKGASAHAPATSQRPVRKQMSRAAALAMAASLAIGAWIGVQLYGKRELPTEVATRPIADPKPVAPVDPTKPKMNGKAVPPPKPEVQNALPPDPQQPDPAETPDPTKGGDTSVVPEPVIPVAPVADGGPVTPPVASDPKSDPIQVPTQVVDGRQPIRPAHLAPGTVVGKSATPAKKTDIIVELNNGYTYRGRIKRVKDDKITLGVTGGEFTFALADVKVLDANAPEYLAEADMPAASVILKSGQRLRGRFLKQNEQRVVLVVEKGEMVIDRAEIREVSFTGRVHF